MGPIWGQQDPGGSHVGPMRFAIWVATEVNLHSMINLIPNKCYSYFHESVCSLGLFQIMVIFCCTLQCSNVIRYVDFDYWNKEIGFVTPTLALFPLMNKLQLQWPSWFASSCQPIWTLFSNIIRWIWFSLMRLQQKFTVIFLTNIPRELKPYNRWII